MGLGKIYMAKEVSPKKNIWHTHKMHPQSYTRNRYRFVELWSCRKIHPGSSPWTTANFCAVAKLLTNLYFFLQLHGCIPGKSQIFPSHKLFRLRHFLYTGPFKNGKRWKIYTYLSIFCTTPAIATAIAAKDTNSSFTSTQPKCTSHCFKSIRGRCI